MRPIRDIQNLPAEKKVEFYIFVYTVPCISLLLLLLLLLFAFIGCNLCFII